MTRSSNRVLAGPHAILEALRSRRHPVQEVWIDANERRPDLVEAAKRANVPIRSVPSNELDALADGLRHQGALALAGDYVYAELEEVLIEKENPLLLALDEITDPHNLGAIVRSAVAFGVDGIVLPRHRAAHVTPVVVRISAGATEHARIAIVKNLATTVGDLREAGVETIGLAAEAERSLAEVPATSSGRLLVIGAEGRGLRRLVRERCESLVKIPMAGPIGSLNASVAAAIALYELTKKE